MREEGGNSDEPETKALCAGVQSGKEIKNLPCYQNLAPPLWVKLKLMKPLCLIKLLSRHPIGCCESVVLNSEQFRIDWLITFSIVCPGDNGDHDKHGHDFAHEIYPRYLLDD